jgi:NADPH2:quinone reductase
MKAFLTRSLTSLDALALADTAVPEPEAGEVVIAVGAASVQLADIAFALGQRLPRPALPFTPGMEAAGLVASVGAGVKGLKKGDLVAAFLPSGGIAEFATAKAAAVVTLPKGVTPTVGASLPHGHAAVVLALRERAALKAGETLVVLGAGGRQGLAAIEIGKQLGARVIAVASSTERREAAAEQGADDVLDPGNTSVAEQVLNLTGNRGADVIFDPVSGDAAIAAFPAGVPGMRYVLTGFAGGSVPRLDPSQLFARDATLIAANAMLAVERDPAAARKALGDVIAWTAGGKLKPRIAAKFALKDARAAFDYIAARRGIGATIVTMG